MVQENGVPVGMKHYPAEFKADAVALYRLRPGATIKSVAGDLGVNTETLRNWIRAANGRRPGTHSAPQTASQTGSGDIQSELAVARGLWWPGGFQHEHARDRARLHPLSSEHAPDVHPGLLPTLAACVYELSAAPSRLRTLSVARERRVESLPETGPILKAGFVIAAADLSAYADSGNGAISARA